MPGPIVRGRAFAGALIVAVAALALAAEARAQASLQVPIQFDFLNPGARSLALGSSFIGLADDATSAFTNPAGLVILRFPEVSFEGRGNRLESPFLQGGRLSGTITGQGIDTVPNAIYGDSTSTHFGPGFLSFVYPGSNWAVAGYRHEFVRLDQSFEAQGVFQSAGQRELALRANRDLSITTYGGAVAYRVHPRVSLGGGISVSTFDLDARFDRFFSPGFFAAPTFDASTQVTAATQIGDDTAVGFNVGGLLTLIDQPAGTGPHLVQLGVVYRKGPTFDFSTSEGPIATPTTRVGTFRTPDTVGVGVAIRFDQSTTLAADVAHVRYSSLRNGYIDVQAVGSGKAANFRITSGTEAHVGLEYVFQAAASPALRVGAWYDPDHAVRYETPANPDVLDERFAAYQPGGESLTHLTFGTGFAPTPRWEVNFAGDISSRTRVFSASLVLRFVR